MEKLNLNYKEIDSIFYPQIELTEAKPLGKYGSKHIYKNTDRHYSTILY